MTHKKGKVIFEKTVTAMDVVYAHLISYPKINFHERVLFTFKSLSLESDTISFHKLWLNLSVCLSICLLSKQKVKDEREWKGEKINRFRIEEEEVKGNDLSKGEGNSFYILSLIIFPIFSFISL